MREGAHGKFTADFMQRTGLEIPPECDPDIPSRRESNLSASDWDPDMEEDYHTYSFGHGVDRLPVLEETELHSAFALKGIAIEENEMSSSSLPNDDLPEAVKAAATSQLDVPSEKASGAGPQGQPQAVELGQEWWRRSGGDFHMDLQLSPTEARVGTGLFVLGALSFVWLISRIRGRR
uniref:Uncharacterized protein n=2 Tax=Guillardia theta TaxID=55529 RepID=A0A7S4L2D6_GUITH|mmetsp:Transcript_36073/g.112749  ORF Transcript_36073/g.112749 Transcript_36073/m.112749 type:complete len:178 (+) Transcript_36073:113-646(+)